MRDMPQQNWRVCKKCSCMFYNGQNLGHCAAGGRHDATESEHYQLHHSYIVPEMQAGWACCDNCQTLQHLGTAGQCPCGGHHTTCGGATIFLHHSHAPTKNRHTDEFRWCVSCECLWLPSSSTHNVCIKGQHSTAGSNIYSIEYAISAPIRKPTLGHRCMNFTHYGEHEDKDLHSDFFHITFFVETSMEDYALTILQTGQLTFEEYDPYDPAQHFSIVDGILKPRTMSCHIDIRQEELKTIVTSLELGFQVTQFLEKPAPPLSTLTLSNNTCFTLEIYRVGPTEELFSVITGGTTVQLTPVFIGMRLNVKCSSGKSWLFVIDELDEKWVLTNRGWIGSLGEFHQSPLPTMAPPCMTNLHVPECLMGLWVGKYSGQDQLIEIKPEGSMVVATKLVGDHFVPAGQVTWKVNNTTCTTMTGQGQMADEGFVSPRWVPGVLVMMNELCFTFTWSHTNFVVCYHRYNPSIDINVAPPATYLMPIREPVTSIRPEAKVPSVPAVPAVPAVADVLGSFLCGRWQGNYGSRCGAEIIEITIVEGWLIATKVTGDVFIPANQISWKCQMMNNKYGIGVGQVAQSGYTRPCWKPGNLNVISQNCIIFGRRGSWGPIKYIRSQ